MTTTGRTAVPGFGRALVVLLAVAVTFGVTGCSAGSGSTTTPTPTGSGASSATGDVVAPVKYSGTGDAVVTIAKPGGDPHEADIATFSSSGSGPFVVRALPARGKQGRPLIDSSGPYRGTVPLDLEIPRTTEALQIASTGPWQVVISALSAARRFTDRAVGTGDDVVVDDSPSASIAFLVHAGRGAFAVRTYGRGDSLVDEVGPYRRTASLSAGPLIVVVHADRAWSIRALSKG